MLSKKNQQNEIKIHLTYIFTVVFVFFPSIFRFSPILKAENKNKRKGKISFKYI